MKITAFVLAILVTAPAVAGTFIGTTYANCVIAYSRELGIAMTAPVTAEAVVQECRLKEIIAIQDARGRHGKTADVGVCEQAPLTV
jgi:hypothetical protein